MLTANLPKLMELEGIVIPARATIESLIAAGQYDDIPDDARQYFTNAYFRVTVEGPRWLFLAHFGKDVTSKHVEAVARQMDCYVALVEDLLCVGAHPQHRELQRHYAIMALGSCPVIDNGPNVPTLSGYNTERRLRLNLYEDPSQSLSKFVPFIPCTNCVRDFLIREMPQLDPHRPNLPRVHLLGE